MKTVSPASSCPDNTATVKATLPALSLTFTNSVVKPTTTGVKDLQRSTVSHDFLQERIRMGSLSN